MWLMPSRMPRLPRVLDRRSESSMPTATASSFPRSCQPRRPTSPERGQGTPAMPIQELFIRLEEDDSWGVRLGKYLLSTQDTQMLALAFAETVARDAATRGVETRLFEGKGQHL